MPFEPLAHIQDFTGGLNTKQRPNKIAPNQSKSIISMDFSANSMRRALGYSKVGSEGDSARDNLVGKTLYTHKILAGVDLMVKSVGTYLEFYDTVDEKWYLLTDATFTAGLHWSFASFNGFLYGNNGIDDWIFWNGGATSTLVNAIAPGGTTIDLQTDHGGRFAASGTVMIQDEAITYTGKTGDQLTGCTITEAHAAGSTVMTKLDSTSYASLRKVRDIKFHQNRLYFIDYDVPTTIFHSKLADNTNPETDLLNFTIAGAGSGDAGFGIAPEELVALKQIINGNSSVMLASFCKDGIIYSFNVIDSATGTTTNAFIPARTMNTYPQAKQLIADAENDVAFVDRLGHTRTLSYGDVNTPLRVQTIADLIEPSLEVTDFSNGDVEYQNRKLYQVGKSENAATNDITFYHDSSYTSWGAYGHWDVNSLAIYNDDLYGLSSISSSVWKLNTGYNANGNTYYSEFQTGDITWGYPLQYKTASKIRISGFITNNCKAYLDVFFDNSANFLTFEISGNDTNIIGNAPNVSVGTVVFGEGVFGGGLPGGTNRKEFWAELRLNDIEHFLKMSLRLRIDDKEVDFEANDIVIFAKLEGSEVWEDQRVLLVS